MLKTVILFSLLFLLTNSAFSADALFDVPVNYYIYRTPYAICSFDFDNDNDNDLAVALYGIDYVSVMLNDGNGAFQTYMSIMVGDGPFALYAVDLNNDNDIDLAVANSKSDNVSVLLNNGDMTFQTAVNYDVGSAPSSVFSCDLDNDFDNDLAVVNYSSYSGGFYHISVLINNGDGTFQNEATYPVGSWPIGVCGNDFDNDGYNDLAVTSFGHDLVTILINNGDGTFESLYNYTSSYGPNSVFSCYLNDDNFYDLAVSNSSSQKVSIFFNNGDGTFQPEVTYNVGSIGYYPTSIFCADFDGDDDNDIVTANKNSNNISILLNNGDETFQPAINYFTGTGPRSVFSADFDGDNDNDIAVANYDADSVSILFNTTSGSLAIEDEQSDGSLPESYLVRQNYPNPFNPSTMIEYSLPKRSHVIVSIYNILGQKVRTLLDESVPAGEHTTAWDGRDDSDNQLVTGVYFYQLQTEDFSESRKMILLK